MTKPKFTVWVDDSPVLPEEPLTAKEAVRWFTYYVDAGEDHVEIKAWEDWA